MNSKTLAAAALAAVLHNASFAAERDHDAHVHGHVLLQMALDGHQLFLEMRSPAMNIVGFEHAAQSDADKASVEAARKTLEHFTALYVVDQGAHCRLKSVGVDSALLDDHDKHDDHGHEEHDHDKHGGDEHSEFHVRYVAVCQHPEALRKIAVNLFARFPSIEEIDVQIISDSGQTALELDRDNPVIVLP